MGSFRAFDLMKCVVNQFRCIIEEFGKASWKLGAPSEGPALVTAQHAARIDRTRAILFHAPTIASSNYSMEGRSTSQHGELEE